MSLAEFQLQAQFAQRAQEITGLPSEQVLMEFTPFWRRTGNLGWSFDPQSAPWQEFLARVQGGEDPALAAFDLYSRNGDLADQGKQYFGCFRFDFNKEFDGDRDIVKIHFKNNDQSGYGPLASTRQPQRMAELREMFADVHEHYPQAQVVHGGSWLYNVLNYRRLFLAV